MKKLLITLFILIPCIAYGDLMTHLTFDGQDMTNGRVDDNSASGNHGYPFNIATTTFYIAGRIGQGFNFDGSNDQVRLPDGFLNSYNAGTITGWVKLDAGGTANCPIIGAGGSTNSSALSYFRLIDGLAVGTRLQFMGDDNNRYLYGNTQFSRGDWYHVAVTSDGTNNKLYVNGLRETETFAGAGISDGWWFNDTTDTIMRYRIGVVPRSSGDIAPCDGVIDDVRIYNKALSENEIASIARAGIARIATPYGVTNNLISESVLHIPFDGNHTNRGVFLDLSGRSNHGRASGISTTTFYTAGKVGQAVNLDGVDDYIDIGDVTALEFDNNDSFSIAAWIKPDNTNEDGYIFSKNAVGTIGYALYFEGTGDSIALMNGTNITGFRSSAVFTNTNWVHVAVTFDGTTARFYRDAEAVGTVTGHTFTDPTSAIARIGGRDGSTAAAVQFQGIIDDLRVYNKTLSATEVMDLYHTHRVVMKSTGFRALLDSIISYFLK